MVCMRLSDNMRYPSAQDAQPSISKPKPPHSGGTFRAFARKPEICVENGSLKPVAMAADTRSGIGIAADITKALTYPTNTSNRILQIVIAWENMCFEVTGYIVDPKDLLFEDPFSGFSSSEIGFADALRRADKRWSDEGHMAPLMERSHMWRWHLPVPIFHA